MPQSSFLNRKAGDLVQFPLAGQVLLRGSGQGQLSQTVLDDRLPHGSHAQENLVRWVLDGGPESGRQARVGGDVPEKDVGVQQQPHRPSNSWRMLSGSGWSKSSGTV